MATDSDQGTDGWGIIKDIYGAKHTAIRLFHRVEMQYYVCRPVHLFV
jgi:hypothetical protein